MQFDIPDPAVKFKKLSKKIGPKIDLYQLKSAILVR